VDESEAIRKRRRNPKREPEQKAEEKPGDKGQESSRDMTARDGRPGARIKNEGERNEIL